METIYPIYVIHSCYPCQVYNGTSIDILLTNKSRCFPHTATFETGLSDCQKLTFTFLKAYFKIITLKNIECRNYKNLNENGFLYKFD